MNRTVENIMAALEKRRTEFSAEERAELTDACETALEARAEGERIIARIDETLMKLLAAMTEPLEKSGAT